MNLTQSNNPDLAISAYGTARSTVKGRHSNRLINKYDLRPFMSLARHAGALRFIDGLTLGRI